jgi:6-phosphogluconolactonase
MQQLTKLLSCINHPICNCVLAAAFAVMLMSCGGSSTPTYTIGGSSTPTYTIGGTVSGLTGGSLVLKNNVNDALTIAANSSSFTFVTPLASGATYSVAVGSQPSSLTCSATNGSGSIANTSIINVTVICKPQYVYVPNRDSSAPITVSVYELSPTTGILTALSPSTVTDPDLNSPIAIAVNPAGTFAYVVNYFSSTVSMFSMNSTTGTLTALSPAKVSTDPSGGAANSNSTSIAINPAGTFAYVVNHYTNNVSMFAINASTGILSPLSTPSIPSGTDPRWISINPAGTFAYVTNYGDNTLTIYSIGNSGSLTAVNTIPTGLGPTQIAIHPGGNYAYVTNSNANSISILNLQNNMVIGTVLTGNRPTQIVINSTGTNAYVVNSIGNTISMYSFVSDGSLTPLSTATIATGTNPVSIGINPSGAYAFVSNAGDSTVSMYSINSSTGILSTLSTPVSTGTTPFFMAVK